MVEQKPTQTEPKRERSSIEFPYVDLDNAIALAKVLHEAGGSCSKDQLAGRVGQSATSGGFYFRIAAAKMFGFMKIDRGAITQTPLGQQVCDPSQERRARVEAFQNVELYKALLAKFKGVQLPGSAGLEAAIVSLGVAAKQKDKARQAFQRSAKQANYFENGPDKLIEPILGNRIERTAAPKEFRTMQAEEKPIHIQNEQSLHPFIEGLLKTLPSADSQWAVEDRKKWLQTAESIFGLIYKD
jgi:hypothetical protein